MDKQSVLVQRKMSRISSTSSCFMKNTFNLPAVHETGTVTIGQGHWDTCVGTWDLRMRGQGYGKSNIEDAGSKVGGKVGVKCDISFFLKMCYLWSTFDSIVQNHIAHLMMFTQNISLYSSKRTDSVD